MARRSRLPKLTGTYPSDSESLRVAVLELQRWVQEMIRVEERQENRLEDLEYQYSLSEGQLHTDGSGGWTLTGFNVDALRVQLEASPSRVFIPFKNPVDTDDYIVFLTIANDAAVERVSVDRNVVKDITGFWVNTTTNNKSDFDPNTNEVGFNFMVRRSYGTLTDA